jgi:dolichyl-diphosphooligosaccharide--protein glycosyltransferase
LTENTPEGNSVQLDILDKVRLSRIRAMEIGVLAVVVAVAVLIRIQPLQYGAYYTAYDPDFQYRVTKHIVENGFASWWTWHDMLSWYPLGRNIANSAYPGVPFTGALLYMLLNAVGLRVSVFDVGLNFPLLMASLTCILSYYLGKELNGKATGLFAAIFMAINPAFIARSTFGFYDTETIGIFAMVAIGFFFLKSIDEASPIERRAAYGMLSGLSLGYMYASWGAARYMTGLLALYMLIMLYSGRFQLRHLISYSLTIGLGYLIEFMVPRLGPNALMSLDHLATFGLVPLMLVYLFVRDKIDVKLVANAAGALILVGVVGIYLLPAVGIDIPITYKFLKVLNPFTSVENALYQSVAENKVIAWASLFQDFGTITILAVAGAYFSVKNQNDKNIYGTVFFVTALYFAGVMARLSQVLAVPACVMGAYGLVEIARPFISASVVEEESRGKKRRKEAFGVNRTLGIAFIALVTLSLTPNIWMGITSADQPTSLANSGIPYMFDGEYPKDWPLALEWMKNNVRDDEVICSWWDYGYWIEAMAGKATMADGATQSENQIKNIANIMMRPQNESIQLLEQYGADYIVVFVTFNPNNPAQEWPFGDNSKWPQMVLIGGFNMTDFYDYSKYPVTETERFYQSTLARLMYHAADPQYFTQAYASPNGYVLVYKIHYPE